MKITTIKIQIMKNRTENSTEMESSSIDMQQKESIEEGDELGDDSDEGDLEYFPNIESLEKNW